MQEAFFPPCIHWKKIRGQHQLHLWDVHENGGVWRCPPWCQLKIHDWHLHIFDDGTPHCRKVTVPICSKISQRPLAQGILKNCSWEVIILSTIFFVSKSKSFFFHQKFGGSFNIQTCSWLVSPFLRGISSPKTTRQRSRDGFVRVLDGAARARLYEGSKSTCRPRCATLVGRFRGEQNYMVLGGSSQDL